METSEIALDQGLFLCTRPVLELGFAGNSRLKGIGTLRVNESRQTVVGGVLTAKAVAVLAEAFGDVVRLPHVAAAISAEEDVDVALAREGVAPGRGIGAWRDGGAAEMQIGNYSLPYQSAQLRAR